MKRQYFRSGHWWHFLPTQIIEMAEYFSWSITVFEQYGPTCSLDISDTGEFLNVVLQLWNILKVSYSLKAIGQRHDTCKPVQFMSNENIAIIQNSSACWKTGRASFCRYTKLYVHRGTNDTVSLKIQFQISSSSCGIISTSVGHTDRINCVSWVQDRDDETDFVSGSADCTVNIWHIENKQIQPLPVASLHGHTGPVTCVSALNIRTYNETAIGQSIEVLVFSASVDSTVRVWSKVGNETKELQVLTFGEGFALSIASCHIPKLNVQMFACGCDDHKIHLFGRADDGKFVKVITLPGHEDWVRGLHFTTQAEDILLASCAQDHLIRVWRFVHKVDSDQDTHAGKPISDMKYEEDITVKERLFKFEVHGNLICFAVFLESVLSGHENWVYSVKWKPMEKGSSDQSIKLLSASMDKTMILWSPDPESGIWTEEVRVGDVGGNSLGLYGGLFSPCGRSIIGHGYQGAFNQWKYNSSSGTWHPEVTGGGHFAPVADLSWAGGGGDYILTVSVDQTTRLHAPWVYGEDQFMWCEVARPQVHGYDLKCLAVLGKYSFASGADEKLIRIFKAPKNFISNFCHICGHDFNKQDCDSLPEGANVPALGLSNKAVFINDDDKNIENEKENDLRPGQYPENYFTPTNLTVPPSEDQLLQNTLWPEEGKLYGHGYEIFSLAAHPDGKILASACKASKSDAANIFLWDMETKKIVGSLTGCSLTVTQMAFNHQGNCLLAVSRDRTWVLYRESAPKQYSIEASVNKKTSSHSRIIWSCAWTHDDKFFLTASRDKTMSVWSVDTVSQSQQSEESVLKPAASLTLPDAVTAVSAAPVAFKGERYMMATGLESGHVSIHLWSAGKESGSWSTLISLTQSEAHHKTVTRLAFRPQLGRLGYKDDKGYLQLASCGLDHAVRVYDLLIDDHLLEH
ncbi:elongator complex protein 2 [Plakobranchus ocellatus]|uniref:Elongator complex protein 2 n=1 Tax=Plakobranchus ocellatus TaxID=259542 RepID=A0AAV3XZ67_9GAST|nr:elongator complex protein 2 [Plakobranchus ocellatus]